MTISVEKSLTKNQALVFDKLDQAEGPLTAYTILDRLRREGFSSPPQVYRALEKLIELGMAHRLETINAYVACRHPECTQHESAVFMICESCDDVAELNDAALTKVLNRLAGDTRFNVENASVELRGTCGTCMTQDGAHD